MQKGTWFQLCAQPPASLRRRGVARSCSAKPDYSPVSCVLAASEKGAKATVLQERFKTS